MTLLCKIFAIFLFLPPLSSPFDYAPADFHRVNWCKDALCTTFNPNATNETSASTILHTCCNCTRRYSHTEIFTDQIEFRRNVVHFHNILRDKLAGGYLKHSETQRFYPSAANMKALSYSMELEYIARCWVVNVYKGHDKCRRTPTVENVGQNTLFLSRKGSPNKWHVYPWWAEHNDYPPTYVNNYTYPPENLQKMNKLDLKEVSVERFVQMAWAETTHIGCARSWNPSNNISNHYAFVCNYAPGIAEGSPLYVRGKPGSQCPEGEQKNEFYTHLCGKIEPIPTNKPVKIYVRRMKDVGEFVYEDMEVIIPGKLYSEPILGRGARETVGAVGFISLIVCFLL